MREIHVIDARAGTTAEKLRVAAYCRVSSDSDDQLNSFLAQVRHYTAYIGQNPEWELADVYADEGLTGTRMDKRDEFNRLMADCRKGQIDLILVKSTSRFARNTMEFLEALRELRQLGVTVWFENENMRTDKLANETMLALSGVRAQQESISISQNQRWSCQKRMQNGTFLPSSAPYGYRIIGGKFVIVEEEARIVRLIFDWYLSGMGKKAITDRLNATQAIKLNGFDKWYIHSVSSVMIAMLETPCSKRNIRRTPYPFNSGAIAGNGRSIMWRIRIRPFCRRECSSRPNGCGNYGKDRRHRNRPVRLPERLSAADAAGTFEDGIYEGSDPGTVGVTMPAS